MPPMAEKHIETFRIRYSDRDRFGCLKLRTLLDYAQEAAGNHAELLGFGMEALRTRHQAWMLSRIRLRILDYPVSETQVQVTTWPSGFERLFATREYSFAAGPEQRVFAEGTSYWVIFDTEARRLLSAPKELADLPCDVGAEERFFNDLGKLPEVRQAPLMDEVKIREHQIDANGHLNNAEYASLVQDVLTVGVRPREMQINYQHEIPVHGSVQLRGLQDGAQFQIAGILADSDTVAFTASCLM